MVVCNYHFLSLQTKSTREVKEKQQYIYIYIKDFKHKNNNR